MSKEKRQEKPTEKDGPVAVACRRKEGRFEVFTVTRVKGELKEEVLKSTDDKRIAADRLQQAVIGVRW